MTPTMSLRRAIFSFHGRIGRIPFLILEVMSIYVIAGATALGLYALAFLQSGLLSVSSLIAAAMLAVLGVWVGVSALVKRLHDIGLGGVHASRMYGLYYGSNIAALHSKAIWLSMVVVGAGVHLWVLLKPGQAEANRYGSATSTTLSLSLLSSVPMLSPIFAFISSLRRRAVSPRLMLWPSGAGPRSGDG